ncbi:transmembrane emp24 domain-containing protein 5 [Culicoides brevitarsis]|uniref:transmembrane emp24 domain-containing protein 5 n=1 Tax=Culicoides brevitarsis TaxID=469753 RepID=UPI00307B8652
MKMYKNFVICVLLTGLTLSIVDSAGIDKEMTIIVEAGQTSCFFEAGKAGQTIDLDYSVIDGGHGDLDISFTIAEGNGKILFTDYKRSENIHRVDVKQDQLYRFCFDNTFSTFNRKTVFFELIIETEGDNSRENFDYEGLNPEDVYEIKVQDIYDSVIKVKGYLTRAKQAQDMLSTYEARDRNIAEQNFHRVNIWSFVQILLMLAVGTLQVFMVRSLFDTDSKANKIWAKFKHFSS